MIVPHFIPLQVLDLDTSAATVCVAETDPVMYTVAAIYVPTNTHKCYTWVYEREALSCQSWYTSWDHLTILGLEYQSTSPHCILNMTVHQNVWTWMCVRHQIENVLAYVFISSAVFLFINLLSFTPLWIVLLQLSMHGPVVFANSMTVNRTRERKITGKYRRNIRLNFNSHEQ